MRNLVASIVVEIKDVFPICGPRVPFNRIACFVSQAMGVSAVERARPNIQRIVFVRRQPAQLGTVRRHFRIRPRLIAEQDFPRDKWRQFRADPANSEKECDDRKPFHFRQARYPNFLPVNRSKASTYLADVFAMTSSGNFGAGGVLSQSSVSR